MQIYFKNIYLFFIFYTNTMQSFNRWCIIIEGRGDYMPELDMSILEKKKLDMLDAYIDTFENKQLNIITILHYAQSVFEYLPKELQLHIARKINMPAVKINGIVSFYSFFSEKPVTKYTVDVCRGTACFVKGAQTLYDIFSQKLNIDEEGISEDGLFSLNSIRCLGACGLGPIVKVNDEIFSHVTNEMVDEIILEYREKEKADENQ